MGFFNGQQLPSPPKNQVMSLAKQMVHVYYYRGMCWTRGTIEEQHFFSMVPHFWELKTRLNPNTDLEKSQNCYRMENPMA